jgi:hypothetical protein
LEKPLFRRKDKIEIPESFGEMVYVIILCI